MRQPSGLYRLICHFVHFVNQLLMARSTIFNPKLSQPDYLIELIQQPYRQSTI